ncbi:MAG: hypothetical protein JWN02_224, partial [Acidobacteria bacterium]|nr:hypothetical protein [Acidobacteriota bacterium]
MKRAVLLFSVMLSWYLPVLAVPPTPSDEQIVHASSPSLLSTTTEPAVDFARADLDQSGSSEYIVAVYCANLQGVVRVLRPDTSGVAEIVAEAAYPAMGGHAPNLRLVDLDGDGSQEIVASFASMGGSESTWIFHWNGADLNLAGPVSIGGRQFTVFSKLGLADFFDADGDAIPEIVEFNRDGDRLLKRQPDGTYVRTQAPVLYVNRFERHTTEAELFTGVFPATAGQRLKVKVVFAPGAPSPPQGDLY